MIRYFGIILLLPLSLTSFAQEFREDSLNRLLETEEITPALIDRLNQESNAVMAENHHWGLEINKMALELADSINYPLGEFRALSIRGNSFWNVGLQDLALSYYLKALEIDVENNAVGYASINNNLGEVFKKKNDFPQALYYYRQAWKIVETQLPDRYPSILSYNIAELYLLWGNIDSAEFYYDTSNRFAILDKNDRGLAYSLQGKGEIQQLRNNLSDAIENHKAAKEIRIRIEDHRGIIQSCFELGECYMRINDFTKAMKEFDEAEEIASRVNANDLLIDVYSLKAELLEKQGMPGDANGYLRMQQQLQDSLHNYSFINSLENTRQALQSEVRLAENQLLKEQRASQEKENQFQIAIIIMISILVLMLILVLFIFYQRQRFSQRNNQKLSEFNRIISRKNQEIENINKGLDERLKNTSKMLYESQEVTRLGSWEFDVKSRLLNFTSEIFKQLGWKVKPSVTFEMIRKLISFEDYLLLKASAFETIRESTKVTCRIRIRVSPGKYTYLNVSFLPEFHEGQLVRLFGTSQDINEQVKQEEQESKIVQSLLEQSSSANLRKLEFHKFLQDLLGQAIEILDVTRAGFWNYKKNELAIQNFQTIDTRSDELESGHVIYEELYPSYFSHLFEERVMAIDDIWNDPRSKEITRSYLQDYDIKSMLSAPVILDGEFLGVLVLEKTGNHHGWNFQEKGYATSLSDIIANAFSTYQVIQLEEEKLQLIENLTTKNRDLEEFGYMISHHLRGPLTQIIGFTNIISDPNFADIQSEIVDRINNAAKKLDNIIKDLSYILEDNELFENPETINLLQVLKSVKDGFGNEINKSGAIFEYDIDPNQEIHTSEKILFRALQNVLSNAIKFRDPGRRLVIAISCRELTDSLEISIKDNGIGIDLEMVGDKIFKMYQRFNLGISGKGLGLYLTKKDLDKIGGKISVESSVDEGSTFIIQLSKSSKISKESILSKVSR